MIVRDSRKKNINGKSMHMCACVFSSPILPATQVPCICSVIVSHLSIFLVLIVIIEDQLISNV